MELTRRDAIAALAAGGIVVGGGAAVVVSDADRGGGDGGGNDDGAEVDGARANGATADGSEAATESTGAASTGPVTGDELDVLVAAAEVLYPSDVEGVRPFVEAYVSGRATDDGTHAAGVADAAAYLDDYAESWYDEGFASLDAARRATALDDMGLRTAEPVPDGDGVERVRYYVRNELLFALYASPTGGELVGLENPQGHPGGTASYRRGPGA